MRPTDQQEKYEGYKSAIETYNKHYESGDLLSAYVLGISILEDIISLTFLDYLLAIGEITSEQKKLHEIPEIDGDRVSVFRMTVEIQKFTFGIDDSKNKQKKIFNKIRKLLLQRNKQLHGAMWKINQIQKSDCDEIMDCFGIMKRYSYHLKKYLQNMEN